MLGWWVNVNLLIHVAGNFFATGGEGDAIVQACKTRWVYLFRPLLNAGGDGAARPSLPKKRSARVGRGLVWKRKGDAVGWII